MSDRERADAARNRQAILDAASTLFDAAADPMAVTMEDVAAAAGVGKGTLFRRFGDRGGLLRAVFRTRIAALSAAVETGPPPLGPGTPAPERITAVLDAIVQVKLSHPQLTHALEHLEQRADRGSLFDSPAYQGAHALFTELLGDVAGDRASWIAHVLLSLTRIDLIEHMVSAEGWTGQQVRDRIRRLAEQILQADGAAGTAATCPFPEPTG